MPAEIVMAVYRAKSGKADEIAGLIKRHVPLLREEGLATARASIVVRSPEDGTFVEIFEWDTADAVVPPHEIPAVKEIWTAMEQVADFVTLGDVPESKVQFPSFTPQ